MLYISYIHINLSNPLVFTCVKLLMSPLPPGTKYHRHRNFVHLQGPFPLRSLQALPSPGRTKAGDTPKRYCYRGRGGGRRCFMYAKPAQCRGSLREESQALVYSCGCDSGGNQEYRGCEPCYAYPRRVVL